MGTTLLRGGTENTTAHAPVEPRLYVFVHWRGALAGGTKVYDLDCTSVRRPKQDVFGL